MTTTTPQAPLRRGSGAPRLGADHLPARPRRRRRPRLALWTVAALVIGCGSYGVSNRVWPGRPGAESESPVPSDPDSVYLVGDSLMFTALWVAEAETGAPANVTWNAWLGWTVADAQQHVDAAVQEGRAGTVVVALGANDSSVKEGADGWSSADVSRFRRVFATVPLSSCLVVVLPGYAPGIDTDHAAELEAAHFDLRGLAAAREQAATAATVVVDWQEVVDAHPNLLHADGVHLARDPVTDDAIPDAAGALAALYWQGIDACTA